MPGFDVAGRVFAADTVLDRFDEWQGALERAHRDRLPTRCLCTPDGVPMVVYRRGVFHFRRAPNGGHAHAPDCRSHALVESPDEDGPDESLYYPRTTFLANDGTALQLPDEFDASATHGRRVVRRRSATLSTILLAIWKRAGLCRWQAGLRPAPWRKVAHALREASVDFRLGAASLRERLVVFADQAEAMPLCRRPHRPGARAPLVLAVGPVSFVRATARDMLVAPWGTDRIWCEDPKCLVAYEEVAARAAAVQAGYVVALLAVYWSKNWRCREWSFHAMTHAWHPFDSPEQGKLYQELVAQQRRFSIPSAMGQRPPWALLWDAAGGPRAIIPDDGEFEPRTVYRPWRWGAQGRLPRAGAEALANSRT